MFAFRVSRIVASLIHRAIFLLAADLLAGPKWFFINNFTGLIDFVFGPDHEYLSSYQDLRFTITGIGFLFAWWMVHFLDSKQLWFNGIAVELFLLVQVLGFFSNLAFTTTNPYQPLLISGVLFVLLDHYRYYLTQLRQLDPEQTLYSLGQLRKPFVPRRALQLIQLTPIFYTILSKARVFFIDEPTFTKLKYAVGMADALVYVGINLDLGLVIANRLAGTLWTAYQDFSLNNFAWMFRVNITGSYTALVRDFGWKSIPADQLHISWFIYWVFKVIMITVLWTQHEHETREPYPMYLVHELSASFVAMTASVYFACLVSGTLLTSIAGFFMRSSDVIPKNSIVQGTFDTVQHIRWNLFPWKVDAPTRLWLTANAIMFGHVPLCGKMIHNVGQTVRRTCGCSTGGCFRTFGSVVAILIYLAYSYLVVGFINIGAPNVSTCFATAIRNMSTVWLGHNIVIAVVEVTSICIHQGLACDSSRENLEYGTSLLRTITTGALAVCLTGVNAMALHETLGRINPENCCSYRDVVHNILQILARLAFIYFTVKNRSDQEALTRLRNVDSLAYQKSCSQVNFTQSQDEPCGLCYDRGDSGCLTRLLGCGHTFHEGCFDSWHNFGQRCPVCRNVFRRPAVEVISHDKLE